MSAGCLNKKSLELESLVVKGSVVLPAGSSPYTLSAIGNNAGTPAAVQIRTGYTTGVTLGENLLVPAPGSVATLLGADASFTVVVPPNELGTDAGEILLECQYGRTGTDKLSGATLNLTAGEFDSLSQKPSAGCEASLVAVNKILLQSGIPGDLAKIQVGVTGTGLIPTEGLYVGENTLTFNGAGIATGGASSISSGLANVTCQPTGDVDANCGPGQRIVLAVNDPSAGSSLVIGSATSGEPGIIADAGANGVVVIANKGVTVYSITEAVRLQATSSDSALQVGGAPQSAGLYVGETALNYNGQPVLVGTQPTPSSIVNGASSVACSATTGVTATSASGQQLSLVQTGGGRLDISTAGAVALTAKAGTAVDLNAGGGNLAVEADGSVAIAPVAGANFGVVATGGGAASVAASGGSVVVSGAGAITATSTGAIGLFGATATLSGSTSVLVSGGATQVNSSGAGSLLTLTSAAGPATLSSGNGNVSVLADAAHAAIITGGSGGAALSATNGDVSITASGAAKGVTITAGTGGLNLTPSSGVVTVGGTAPAVACAGGLGLTPASGVVTIGGTAPKVLTGAGKDLLLQSTDSDVVVSTASGAGEIRLAPFNGDVVCDLPGAGNFNAIVRYDGLVASPGSITLATLGPGGTGNDASFVLQQDPSPADTHSAYLAASGVIKLQPSSTSGTVVEPKPLVLADPPCAPGPAMFWCGAWTSPPEYGVGSVVSYTPALGSLGLYIAISRAAAGGVNPAANPAWALMV